MENRGESFLVAYPNSEPLSRLKYNLSLNRSLYYAKYVNIYIYIYANYYIKQCGKFTEDEYVFFWEPTYKNNPFFLYVNFITITLLFVRYMYMLQVIAWYRVQFRKKHVIFSKTSHFTRNHPITLLPQQDFGPRGPRPEEAYIVTPARNMNKYILVIPQKNLDMFILSSQCALG